MNVACCEFVDSSEARELLLQADPFLLHLSKADLAFRTAKRDAVLDDYRFLVGKSVRDWTDPERGKVGRCFASAVDALGDLAGLLVSTVKFLKCDGGEEPGNAYCRGSDSLVLHERALARIDDRLSRLIAHELFHLVSRNHPGLRECLYGLVGFHRSDELRPRKEIGDSIITNPDAPVIDYYFDALVRGRRARVYPILMADEGSSFDHESLTLRFFDPEVERLLRVEDLENFSDAVGGNTDYIIHPEEIIAENVTKLAYGEELKDEWLIRGIEREIGRYLDGQPRRSREVPRREGFGDS